jgi:uncharacterized glyoxalase superfamily protein PhnB
MLANRSIPRCAVIPEIPYPDVGEAARWLCDAFGFTVRIMIGNHRAQLNVGDCAMVVIEGREGDGGRSCLIRVEDVDGALERAIQHGAKVLRAPADYPYGERQATVEDFAGHRWTFSQSIADVDPRDWGGTPGQL